MAGLTDPFSMETSNAMGMPIDTTGSGVEAIQPMSIDMGSPLDSIPVRPEVANDRAYKASIGLPSESFRDIHDAMATGQEKQYRERASLDMDLRRRAAAMDFVRETTRRVGRALTAEETAELYKTFDNFIKATDPDTLVEEYYGKEVVGQISKTIDAKGGPAKDGKDENPNPYNMLIRTATDLQTKREIVLKHAQTNEQILKDQGWVPWVADFMKGFVPLYSDVKLRGFEPSTSRFYGTLDVNLRAQADALLLIRNPVEMNKKIQAVMDKLNTDNPQAGQQFVSYLLGKTYDEGAFEAFQTIGDLTALPLLKGAKGLVKGGQAVYNFRETARVVKDTLKGIPSHEVGPHTLPEAVGNLPEAAVQEMRARVIANMKGATDEQKEAVSNLFDIFQLNKATPNNPSSVPVTAKKQITPEEFKKLETNIANKEAQATELELRSNAALPANIKKKSAADAASLRKDIETDRANLEASEVVVPPKKMSSEEFQQLEIDIANRKAQVSDLDLRQNTALPANIKKRASDDATSLRRDIERDEATLTTNRFEVDIARKEAEAKRLELAANANLPADQKARLLEAAKTLRENIAADRAGQITPTPTAGTVQVTPQKILELRRGLANILDEQASKAQLDVMQSIFNMMKINILPGLDSNVETVVRGLYGHVQELYPHLSDRVLNISYTGRDKLTNVHQYEMFFGQRGHDTYSSPEKAKIAAQMVQLPSKAYEIVPHGAGYAIKINKSLDITEDFIRDMLQSTNASKAPDSYMNSIMGWANARTPEEMLSFDHRMQRKTATYAPSNYLQVVKDMSAPIQELARFRNRTAFRDWERIIKLGWKEFDEDGKLGKYYNVHELQDRYLTHLKRMPSELEIQAYSAWKNVMDFDFVLRNFHMYQLKARLGTEQINISLPVKDILGAKKDTGWFEGIKRKDLPRNEDTILIMGRHPEDAEIKVGGGAALKQDQIEYYEARIKKGELSVYEIYDTSSRPLKDWSDKVANAKVRYVITHTAETKPITVNQIPRRQGGHFEYEYDWYIKQAKIRPEAVNNNIFRNWYEGDTTIMPMMMRGMGEKVVKELEAFRLAIKNGNEAEAAQISRRLDIEHSTLRGWFEESTNPVTKQLEPARLSKDEPIQLVPKDALIGTGETAKELQARYGATFKDGTRSGDLSKLNQVEYAAERDVYELFTLRDTGTRHNPLWDYEPAKMVDPLVSINRAVSRIIKSSFMDDYKTFAIEHWLESAKKYLDMPNDQIRYAPFDAFHNANFLRDADPTAVARLENQRHQINQFLGVKSDLDNILYRGAVMLADGIYGKLGPKSIPFDPSWLLPKIKDPLEFLRAATFHAKLGLFNPAQLIIQANGFVNIAAVAGGKHAASGAYTMMLTQWARTNSNPAILAKLDEMATKLRMPGGSWWKAGEFTESLQGLKNSGFMNVGGEYVLKDSALNPNVFNSRWGQFLDAGAWFFNEGERATRIGAWHTSYREFRDKFPTAKIGGNEWQQIQERADLLSNNMSRASASGMHTGVMQFPAQFLAYTIRLAELFWGKRLGETVQERNLARLRMLGWYGTMYGAPVAVGVTGLPFVDSIRQAALERGYVVGEKWYSDLLMGGFPAFLTKLATGGDYSIGDSLGIQGMENIRDALTGDKTFMDIAGGASFGLLKGTYQGLSPFWALAVSGASKDGHVFNIKWEDYFSVAREWAAADKTKRTIIAFNTQKWISKKGVELENIKPIEALMMTAFGVQPQSVPDAYLFAKAMKSQKTTWDDAEKLFAVEFRKGIQAERNKDPKASRDYLMRAFIYLEVADFPVERIMSAIKKAIEGQETLVNKLEFEWVKKSIPSKYQQRMKDLKTKRELRGEQ